MRALLVALAVVVALFAGAAGATLLIERRVAALAPDMAVGALHYNPLTGRLRLIGVRARDAAGREIFRAAEVEATANPLRLLGGTLTLGRVRVTAPRLTLHTAGLDLADLAAGFGAAPAALPLRIDDLTVAGGEIVVDGAGEAGAPVAVRDLNVRLSRLTTAASGDVAFAVEMAAYGTMVHVTGQPRGGGYAVRVRAHGLDIASLLRDFPSSVPDGLTAGRGDIEADVVLSEGRLLTSGSAKLTDVVLPLAVEGRPPLRVASVVVVVDAFDVATGAGRITRLDLGAPVLELPADRAAAAFAALVEPLRRRPDLIVRRVAVTDGTLALGDVRLQRVHLTAHAPGRRDDGAWLVSAYAAMADDAEASIDGVLARDLTAIDGVLRLQRVALDTWRTLGGPAPDWNARVSFDGRLRLVARDGDVAATVAGQAVLADVTAMAPGGFRAERIVLGVRRWQWPSADAVVDTVVLTRPAFALPMATPWPRLSILGNVDIVEGELREAAIGRALREMDATLAPDAGGARLRLTASADGRRLGVDRVLPYDGPGESGVPLRILLTALEDAARTAPVAIAPSALPAAALER